MIVLIDNDRLIQLSWTLQAKAKNLAIRCFSSSKEFIQERNQFSHETPIFIDSDLGIEKGEIEAKEIFSLGFKNITLCTGYSDMDISDYPWISKIISKRPPF